MLEAGGDFNESDFSGLELPAFQQLFWRGGPTPTADFNVTLLAGGTLGGGPTVNWSNCLRTPAKVRGQWAREFGLEGLDGPDYDRHMEAVWTRLGVNGDCSDLNGPHERMRDGAAALGWSFTPLDRNADPAAYSPDTAGYIGLGDRSGAKLDVRRTYLRDAVERRCSGDRALPRRAGADRERSRLRCAGDVRASPNRSGRARRGARARASSSRADHWSRRRCCCAPASAGRQSGTTCTCTPWSPLWHCTPNRSGHGGAHR